MADNRKKRDRKRLYAWARLMRRINRLHQCVHDAEDAGLLSHADANRIVASLECAESDLMSAMPMKGGAT